MLFPKTQMPTSSVRIFFVSSTKKVKRQSIQNNGHFVNTNVSRKNW